MAEVLGAAAFISMMGPAMAWGAVGGAAAGLADGDVGEAVGHLVDGAKALNQANKLAKPKKSKRAPARRRPVVDVDSDDQDERPCNLHLPKVAERAAREATLEQERDALRAEVKQLRAQLPPLRNSPRAKSPPPRTPPTAAKSRDDLVSEWKSRYGHASEGHEGRHRRHKKRKDRGAYEDEHYRDRLALAFDDDGYRSRLALGGFR